MTNQNTALGVSTLNRCGRTLPLQWYCSATAVGELYHWGDTTLLLPWHCIATAARELCHRGGNAVLLWWRKNWNCYIFHRLYKTTYSCVLSQLDFYVVCFEGSSFLKNSSFFILHSSFKILTFAENLWNHGLYLRHQAFCHQRRTWHQNNHFHEGLPPALRVVPQPWGIERKACQTLYEKEMHWLSELCGGLPTAQSRADGWRHPGTRQLHLVWTLHGRMPHVGTGNGGEGLANGWLDDHRGERTQGNGGFGRWG